MRNRCFHMILTGLFLLGAVAVSNAADMAYDHEIKAEDISFAWRVEGEQIHVKLTAKTTGWVGIGFDPENAMEGGDIIIGAVKSGTRSRLEDHYGDRKRGHSKDESLGGTTDILNPSGSEADGVTTITFTRSLKATDKYDKSITVGGMYRIMLAYGGGKDNFTSRHPFRAVYDVDLATGKHNKIK